MPVNAKPGRSKWNIDPTRHARIKIKRQLEWRVILHYQMVGRCSLEEVDYRDDDAPSQNFNGLTLICVGWPVYRPTCCSRSQTSRQTSIPSHCPNLYYKNTLCIILCLRLLLVEFHLPIMKFMNEFTSR